jgi:hypothetical protein
MYVRVLASAFVMVAAWSGTAFAGSYNNILIGRGQFVQGNSNCAPLPGAVNLFQVAKDLHTRGLTASPVVTTSQQLETTRRCAIGGLSYASWQDLMTLHAQYGWEDVSRGVNGLDLTTATSDQVRAETCDSLPVFEQHGFSRAWGLYGYEADKGRTAANQSIVNTCFAFGRQYVANQSNPLPIPSPYWYKTQSVNGGHCAATGQACSSISTPYPYTSPATLASLMNPGANRLGSVQFYRFVSGSYGNPGQDPAWDCMASDWHRHWSSNSELYCYKDFLQVANAARSALAKGVINADPAEIGILQGRDFSKTGLSPPMVSVTMSRTGLSAADMSTGGGGSCVRDDESIAPLDSVILPWIAANTPDVRVTGSVETGVTKDAATWCSHYGWTVAASWADMAQLQSQYQIRFVSHSSTYAMNWPDLTDAQKQAQTCGSRNAVTAHGLLGADGQFDWPNNIIDSYTQSNFVIPCFYFNRVYGGGLNTLTWARANHNEVSTAQLAGGSCNASGLDCSTADGPLQYIQPSTIISLIENLQPDQHLSLQGYVFVTGTNPAYSTTATKPNTTRWDCTSPDPAYHWSNDVERYCWSDFELVLNALQKRATDADTPIVITDPETVARTWGMTPPSR